LVIYLTTNLVNDKIYIGQTMVNDFNFKYIGSGSLLHKAIKKYGKENFVRTNLQYTDNKEDLDWYEQYWIDFFRKNNWEMYNISAGGDGCKAKGLKRSEETKKRMSESKKGNKNPAKQLWVREKISNSQKGKSRPKGRKATEETKKKISDSWKHRIVSDETKQKMSKSLLGNTYSLGNKQSEETKKKKSDKLKGRIFTEVHRQRLKDSARNRSPEQVKEQKEKMWETRRRKVWSEAI
jgi:group I intron endonuclease